ncbi:MAG: deoxyribose-phosphate aldolase [Anaerolineaceae bacterium]|nr:deoxyribose-phosphate aldolase [Anaerolineaceae bacterium]
MKKDDFEDLNEEDALKKWGNDEGSWDDEDWDDEDDFDDYWDDEDDDELEVVVDSAEGLQVATTFDSEGNVIDVSVTPEDEIDNLDTDVECPLNSFIDHTLLKPDATVEQITKLCQEAREFKFASVCVNSCWVRLCSELLRGSGVAVCTVVGFPLGAMIPEAKAFEAEAAIENGATEIDMVINVGALKSQDYRMAAKDIQVVCDAVHQHGALLKVIIETCLLTREEKVIACLLAKNAGADYVKTSTGFSTGGATVEDVELMRKVVGEEMGVKASGGIRDKETAEAMLDAGADRLGASAGVKICS